ncbi:MAG: glycoside hydrolase family 172 protein [bacterium]
MKTSRGLFLFVLADAVLCGALVAAGCGGGDGADNPSAGSAAGLRLEPPGPGVEAVADAASLPLLRYRTLARQLSSHDQTGGNDDGFPRNTQLYADEKGEYVVFDDYGPGCIYRMWFTALIAWDSQIRIYVEDMETPLVDLPFTCFFSQVQAPFLFPLVNFISESGGGYVCYVPICYRQRAKITLSVPPEYYNITFQRFDGDQTVETFSGDEDYSRLFAQWEEPARDPKPPADVSRRSGRLSLPAGGSGTFLSEQGAGAVWNLYLDVVPFGFETASSIWIVAHWDGHLEPDIQAPVNEFFGSYYPEAAPQGLLFGRKDGRYYCRFPMPFWSSAALTLENRGEVDATIDYELEVLDARYPAASGYFIATHRQEDPTAIGRDYGFASFGGSGHFVGVTYTMTGPIPHTYMEGDERFYVNGSLSPAIYGTGTEDYFNAGWYIVIGPFSRPLHGSPFRLRRVGARSQTGCYRVHLGDLVPFFNGADFGIEHDGDNTNIEDTHSSVAYGYGKPDALLSSPDELHPADASSRAEHGYAAQGVEPSGIVDSVYEGDADDVIVTDEGHLVAGWSEFDLAIDPANVGVLLRRRLDQSHGRQKAEVFVDGSPAGIWYDVWENPRQRWADSDFLLPASLTAGRDRVRVRIANQGESPWTEFVYRAFSYLPAE